MQVGHACLEAGCRFQPEDGCYLVVLHVPDEIELRLAVQQAEAIGIQCELFYEPDDGTGFTAACTEPITDPFRRFFRRYPLWTESEISATPRGPP